MLPAARPSLLLHGARWALLLPFLLLTLLAPGVMPHRAADGQIALILCTTDGPVETVIDLATGQPVPAQPQDDPRCAWSVSPLVLAQADVPLLAWPLVLVRAEKAAGASLWRAGALPGAVTARGPPIRV